MKLFLDTEFNGFGGKLMSMALVPEDDRVPNWYCELVMTDQLHPWVKENVVPHMILVPSTMSQFQAKLTDYLFKFQDITIVADWPDDIRYFCESLITGPGERIVIPTKIKFELDLNIKYESAVAHNALHDAMGIREYYRKTVK
jgi:hypothetical protein